MPEDRGPLRGWDRVIEFDAADPAAPYIQPVFLIYERIWLH